MQSSKTIRAQKLNLGKKRTLRLTVWRPFWCFDKHGRYQKDSTRSVFFSISNFFSKFFHKHLSVPKNKTKKLKQTNKQTKRTSKQKNMKNPHTFKTQIFG